MAVDLGLYEQGAPFEGDYKSSLDALQGRISRLFVSNLVHGKSAILAFEGWDAAGKGGAIQRMTADCDPRAYRVWPIAAPTEEEKTHHYLWRFWKRLPKSGQVAIFDRSWYGRVLVERVEGFATEAQWRRAYDEINEFESQLAADGILIIKLFIHVTTKVQAKRLQDRLDHPWKRWKVNSEDFRNLQRREAYLAAMEDMFDLTDTRWAPWTVIDGNNKKAARIKTLSVVAEALEQRLPPGPPPLSPEMEQLLKMRSELGE